MTEQTPGLLAAMTRQADILVRTARMAEERGYYILISGLNANTMGNYPYRYFVGAANDYIDKWCALHGRKYIGITIWPKLAHTKQPVTEAPVTFKFTLPRTRKFRIIVASLELMGKRRTNRRDIGVGSGPLLITELHNRFDVQGFSREALDTAMAVLNMPQHREILRGQYRHADNECNRR